MMRAALLLIVLLAGCTPVVPDPPIPDPVGTPCEQAFDNWERHDCGDVERATYVDACERYTALGGENSWHPDCQRAAESCAAIEACRAGQ